MIGNPRQPKIRGFAVFYGMRRVLDTSQEMCWSLSTGAFFSWSIIEMKRVLVYGMVCALGLTFLAGCGDETKVKDQKTTTTPGGKTTTTDEHTVKQSGQNPPKPK
jgi:hypothetical protein